MPDTNPHKITGYRNLSQEELDMVNKIKAHAIETGKLCDEVNAICTDNRWHAIGKTDLQKGFMGLIRAVTAPDTF